VKAPYIPEIMTDTDVSSFETTFTREAAVDSVSEKSGGNTNKKEGGIMKMLGFKGSNKGGAAEPAVDDTFKGFAFAKDETVVPENNANKD